jgi:ABC-type transport system substrate-binding protein
MDVFAGIGQWMYRLASKQMEVKDELNEAKVSLDGVTVYGCSVGKAKEKLEKAGWTLDENGGRYKEGIRYKEIDGKLVGLKMTMGMPESEEARAGLEKYLLRNLEEAGIHVAVKLINMELIEKNYEEESMFDMLYLGENFMLKFDPQLLAPAAWNTTKGSLTDARAELLQMAEGMVRTEPTDVAGFMKKWVNLQERISETLPVIPVYSNAYFDFYTRELHQYNITEAVTWGEAIVKSYMSDIEEIEEEQEEENGEETAEVGEAE